MASTGPGHMQIASRILLGGVRRAFITRALYIARIGLRIHASIDTEYGVCVCVCVCVCVSMYIVISLLFAYRFRPSKAKKKLRIRFFFIWPLDLSRRMVLMFDIFSVLHVIPYCYILRERVCECVHKNMPMNETLYFRYVSYCTSHTNLIMWFLFRYSCIMLFTNTHTHTHTHNECMHEWNITLLACIMLHVSCDSVGAPLFIIHIYIYMIVYDTISS